MTPLRKDLPVKSKRGITMPNVFYNLLNKWLLMSNDKTGIQFISTSIHSIL